MSEKFRRIAMTVYGYGRGSISKAAEEALAKWCQGHEPSNSEVAASGEHSEVPRSQNDKTALRVDPDERADIIETRKSDKDTPSV